MFARSLAKNSRLVVTRLFPSARLMSSNALLFKRRPDSMARITPTARPILPKSRNPVGFGLCNGGVRAMSDLSGVLMPAVKILLASAGYVWRKWWQSSDDDRRQRYQQWADENRYRLRSAVALTGALAACYLSYHVERDPVSGRLVLLLFNERTIESMADRVMWSFVLDFANMIVRPTDRRHKRVASLTAALVKANQHVPSIRDRRWNVVMFDDRNTWNAFSLPNATIFVFTGLSESTNDDQLSVIIGHEMAHCTLRHKNRDSSVRLVADVLHALFITATWARLWAAPAVALHLLSYIVVYWVLLLPRSRRLELEADRIGFMIAAAACVDVDQGPVLWNALADAKTTSQNTPWFTQTHPTERERAHFLTQCLPEARRLRELFKCD